MHSHHGIVCGYKKNEDYLYELRWNGFQDTLLSRRKSKVGKNVNSISGFTQEREIRNLNISCVKRESRKDKTRLMQLVRYREWVEMVWKGQKKCSAVGKNVTYLSISFCTFLRTMLMFHILNKRKTREEKNLKWNMNRSKWVKPYYKWIT